MQEAAHGRRSGGGGADLGYERTVVLQAEDE
jgi:hypothetical protein